MAELYLKVDELNELVTEVRALVTVLRNQAEPKEVQLSMDVTTGEMPAAPPFPEPGPPVEAPETTAETPTPAVEEPVQGLPVANPTYTVEALAQASVDFTKKDPANREAAVALIHSYGVESLSGLPQEQYGAFASDLRKLGAAI